MTQNRDTIDRLWNDVYLEFATDFLRTVHLSACIFLENNVDPSMREADITATVIDTLRKIAIKIKDGRLNRDGTPL